MFLPRNEFFFNVFKVSFTFDSNQFVANVYWLVSFGYSIGAGFILSFKIEEIVSFLKFIQLPVSRGTLKNNGSYNG